jgi:hypothetical protein
MSLYKKCAVNITINSLAVYTAIIYIYLWFIYQQRDDEVSELHFGGRVGVVGKGGFPLRISKGTLTILSEEFHRLLQKDGIKRPRSLPYIFPSQHAL